MDLASGKTFDIPNASGFQFSKDGQFLAVKLNGAAGAAHRGTDLLLRRLSDGLTQNIGNVYQYAFDGPGRYLAYSVDAPNKLGNGLYVLRPASGETRVLDSSAQEYDGLTWQADGAGLAVLRGEKPAGKELKQNVLLASDEITRKLEGRKALILLSDGEDHGSRVSLNSAIEAAQRSDTLIYAILFSDGPGGQIF